MLFKQLSAKGLAKARRRQNNRGGIFGRVRLIMQQKPKRTSRARRAIFSIWGSR